MRIKRLIYIMIIFVLLFVSVFSGDSQAATRRSSRTNTNTSNANRNTPATQAQSGSGAEMTAEDEQNLMDAAAAMRKSGLVQFNFKDMDLVRFMRFMSEVLQENIIVPPNINSKITIISPHPVNLREAREIMLSTLQMYNFSLQNMGSYSIVRQGGNSPSPNVSRGKSGPGFGEETVTYIVPIDYITVESVIPALQQSFGPALIVLAVGNGRDILLQGRATDVNKGVELLRKMDTPQSARMSRTFEIKNGDPATIAAQINAIAQTGGPLQNLNAIADVPSKKVILVGSRSALDRAEKILHELDVAPTTSDFHVYKLKHIDATAAAEQMTKILAASATITGQDASKAPSTVVADVATNSLIFAVTQKQYDSILNILEAIDIQAKQVLLRGFIAEINVTNLERNGIDWSVLGGQVWDSFMIGAGGQLGEGSIPSTFSTWFNDLSKREELLERNGSTYTVTNYHPMALMYATIEMLRRYDSVNVLSVPRLLCTDNKESSFQVGQVIPVLKGSASDISNPGALQQNYDYKDTGLTLTVTPHIRNGNVVALDIKQTTEDVLTAAGSVTPITSKREVHTTVTVADGETVILGGMIKETERSFKRRVPGFSYIPLIGGLFQKLSKEKEKVDFVIFLTPQIIESPDELRTATLAATGFTDILSRSSDVTFDQYLLPGARDVINSVDIGPVESEVDRRFREIYRKSLKRK
mgnify:CR=1 FL=1